ncbi:regulator of G protein signaling domain protein [Necator americanus]|uniref:Regulator of G protein signaling domain protein n=1 Tax=Necator americanus TaxID=51031 RepID=W2SPG5_NECAM|nr:regulator of G protein signaling domain protein [Necator americanus]ETN70592.1 regulator of G protein signaling domain protein [Necator americanus]
MKIFKRVLRDPKLRQPFQLFLEQQFCAENLNFYVAVERFRDMQFNNESKASERASFARHIYERHFAANSTEPVNVDNSTSKRIRETMQAGKYPRNTFDLAQYQIFHLLKYDCWPRFLRAGGVQPEFSDEELAEEDERQHRLDIGEDLPESHGTRATSESERQPSTSLSTLCSERKKMSIAPSPPRHPPPPRVEPKHCRLMTGDTCSTELVELNDPTISVRQWTQCTAAMLGMDKNACEAVDAETCNTIDPARQAIDALQSRSVRIVPVVTFAVEILPPNYSFKNPSSTPTKIIMVRARQSLSAGGVLRPLLSKYSIDYNTVTVVFSGTLETIRNSVSIGNIGTRSLTVMSQSQYNERTHGGKKDVPTPKDPIATSPNLAAEHNLQFHQHGDISYCELPSEADRLKHAQKEHSISLMKFVRKASAAVTNKEEPVRTIGQRIPSRRKSVGQGTSAGVYCGEETPTEPPKEPIRKRLSLFKNKSKDSPHDRPSTSADRGSTSESPRIQTRESSASTPLRQSTAVASPPSPALSAVSPTGTSSKAPASPRTSNGDTPRTPAIFSSKVCSEGEEVMSNERGWQTAAYV